MMRFRLALVALLLVPSANLAVPAIAQPDAELSFADVQAYGDWMAKAFAVDAEGQKAFIELMPRMNAMSQQVRDRQSARTVSAELAALIAGVRPQLLKTQDALRALVPIAEPLDSRYPFPTRQLKADLLRTGEGTIAVIDATVGLANAMAADDKAAAARHANAVKQGATLLVDGQITLVRARRSTVSPSESTHQALGLLETLYLGISLTMKQRFESGPWPRTGYLQLADQAQSLSAKGRSNLARELDLAKAARPAGSEDRRAAAVDLEILTIEQDSFVQGDALAATLKALADADRQSATAMMTSLTAIESQLADIGGKQARALGAR